MRALKQFIADMWPALIFSVVMVLGMGTVIAYVLRVASGGIGNLF